MFVRLASLIVFAIIGWQVSLALSPVADDGGGYLPWGLAITAITVVSGAAGGIYGPRLVSTLTRLVDEVSRVSLSTIISGTLGLIVGLIVAALVSIPFFQLPGELNWIIPFIIMGTFAFVGLSIGLHREHDLHLILPGAGGGSRGSTGTKIRILVDTSAIIDGRIGDLSETGFVQGSLIVPQFVLDELRHIADSSDALRRTRGRRGLEVLSNLRRNNDLPIQFTDAQVPRGGEVDSELVRMAKEMKAYILTTDYNLNRVAELNGVHVLNVNQLANALKPVVLPGETMAVNIIQEGKEMGQGVAFLDDGTMVVVEGGRRFMNSIQEVTVTRVLQTAAGRIIFAQPRGIYR